MKSGICILTMTNGIDVIGELSQASNEAWFVKLANPCLLTRQSPSNVALNNMLHGSTVLAGSSIMVNMRAVMWISEPSAALLSAYQASLAGLLLPHPKPLTLNQ